MWGGYLRLVEHSRWQSKTRYSMSIPNFGSFLLP
jgi:hypothetical protein